MIHLERIAWGVAIGAAVLAVAWWHGYSKGHEGVIEIEAVAKVENARYRNLEKGVQDAQAGYVAAWTRQRDNDRAEWVRIRAESARRVPAVCPVTAGAGSDQGGGVEEPRPPGNRDLHRDLVDALETGERLEAALTLCQVDLRACAGLR